MSRPPPRASGYFRTDYRADLALVQTRLERVSLALFLLGLTTFPFLASPFQLDLASQDVLIETIRDLEKQQWMLRASLPAGAP